MRTPAWGVTVGYWPVRKGLVLLDFLDFGIDDIVIGCRSAARASCCTGI